MNLRCRHVDTERLNELPLIGCVNVMLSDASAAGKPDVSVKDVPVGTPTCVPEVNGLVGADKPPDVGVGPTVQL